MVTMINWPASTPRLNLNSADTKLATGKSSSASTFAKPSYFIMSQHIAKRCMIEQRSGRIINIASIAGLGGNPPELQMIAYNTSKGAVVNFSRALGAEWGKYNITVNAICPGFFPSRLTASTIKSIGEKAMASHAPLLRLGDDEDLKGITLLYASDAGKHITGQYMAVDGGVSIVTGG